MKSIHRYLWQNLLIQVFGTALGVILTLGTGHLISQHKQRESKRMTALMVLSNIESFCHTLDEISGQMARLDTVATWLLAIPEEQISRMDPRELHNIIQEAVDYPSIYYDKTAQGIFGNNLSTWENLGNFGFIDHVGKTFYGINMLKDLWEEYGAAPLEIYEKIYRHPDDYPGTGFCEKFLRNKEARTILGRAHARRLFIARNAAIMRTNNRINMGLIGFTEEEVMAFTDNMQNNVDEDAIISSMVLPEYQRPRKDSLFTMPAY